jgi:hypothetical protein
MTDKKEILELAGLGLGIIMGYALFSPSKVKISSSSNERTSQPTEKPATIAPVGNYRHKFPAYAGKPDDVLPPIPPVPFNIDNRDKPQTIPEPISGGIYSAPFPLDYIAQGNIENYTNVEIPLDYFHFIIDAISRGAGTMVNPSYVNIVVRDNIIVILSLFTYKILQYLNNLIAQGPGGQLQSGLRTFASRAQQQNIADAQETINLAQNNANIPNVERRNIVNNLANEVAAGEKVVVKVGKLEGVKEDDGFSVVDLGDDVLMPLNLQSNTNEVHPGELHRVSAAYSQFVLDMQKEIVNTETEIMSEERFNILNAPILEEEFVDIGARLDVAPLRSGIFLNVKRKIKKRNTRSREDNYLNLRFSSYLDTFASEPETMQSFTNSISQPEEEEVPEVELFPLGLLNSIFPSLDAYTRSTSAYALDSSNFIREAYNELRNPNAPNLTPQYTNPRQFVSDLRTDNPDALNIGAMWNLLTTLEREYDASNAAVINFNINSKEKILRLQNYRTQISTLAAFIRDNANKYQLINNTVDNAELLANLREYAQNLSEAKVIKTTVVNYNEVSNFYELVRISFLTGGTNQAELKLIIKWLIITLSANRSLFGGFK